MKIEEYIAKNHKSKAEFARLIGVRADKVSQWIKLDWIVLDGKIYSPKREIPNPKGDDDMNRAEQAKLAFDNKGMSFTELLIEANEIAEAYEQDFDNEVTRFEYADGSVAAFMGIEQEIRTYGSRN